MCIYLIFIPIGVTIFFRKNLGKFSSDEFQQRFGSLYLNLKEDVPYALTHTILYFIRRLLYAISLVFLGDFPALQNILFILLSLGLLTFQFRVLPMDDRQSQALEIFNEVCICLIGTFLMPFSSEQFGREQRQTATSYGWVIVSITLLSILVNQLIMVISVGAKLFKLIKKGIKKLKKWWKERKQARKEKCKNYPL